MNPIPATPMQTSRQSAIEVLAGTLIGFLVANGSGQIGTALTHLPEQNLLYKLAPLPTKQASSPRAIWLECYLKRSMKGRKK